MEVVALGLVFAGLLFYVAGTVGLVRFPDTHSRIHALTKADNVGLGLLVAGLCVRAPSVGAALRYLLVWALVLAASATASHLVARSALRTGGR